jgi:hypothetical protein
MRKKKKVKRPTYPIFLGYVTLITHIFLFGLMAINSCISGNGCKSEDFKVQE